MISLIIPCYKNPKYLDLCLKSAVENKEHPQTEIIVVLDGFSEMFDEIVGKYRTKVRFYAFPENQGMQNALNYGVFKAMNDYVLIANDDNVFGIGWDNEVRMFCQPNVVTTINQIEPPKGGFNMFGFNMRDFGQTVETFDYDGFLKYERSIPIDVCKPTGATFPFALTKQLYLSVGGFDTIYDSPNICDWDFFLKLQLTPNVVFTRIHNVHFYHFGSIVTKHTNEAPQFNERSQAAAEMFQTKWGFPPTNIPGYNIKFPIDKEQINGIKFPKPVFTDTHLTFEENI